MDATRSKKEREKKSQEPSFWKERKGRKKTALAFLRESAGSLQKGESEKKGEGRSSRLTG